MVHLGVKPVCDFIIELKTIGVANRKYRAKNHQKDYERLKAFRKAHPEVLKARNAVSWALKTGELVRPSSCSACGKACKPEGHHPNYNEPLSVVWLCPPCHGLTRLKSL